MKRNFAYALIVMLVAVASCSFMDINDDFSEGVYTDFIEILDPTKRFFLKEDIEEFEQFKYSIDEQVKNTDIEFFNLVYDRLMLRMDQAKDSRAVLKERWRKQLKYITMGTYDGKLEASANDAQDMDAENPVELLSPAEAEIASRESTLKTLNEYFDFIDDLQRKDWFEQYLNTIVDEFDPHTYYFGPKEKEKSALKLAT